MLKLLKENYHIFVLLIICALGFYFTFYPHLNYSLPLHLDEWWHFSFARETMDTGHIPHYLPHISDHLSYLNWEVNFHSLISQLLLMSPLHPEKAWIFYPAVFSLLLILFSYLLVYKITDSKLAGLCAALFSFTIRSNVVILGPWFLAPITLGLTLSPLILYLFVKSFHKSSWRFFFLFCLCYASLMLMNPHAIVLTPVFAVYLITHPKLFVNNFLQVALAVFAASFLFSLFFPSVFSDTSKAITDFFDVVSRWNELPGIPRYFLPRYITTPTTVLAVVGIFFSFHNFEKPKSVLTFSFLVTLSLVWFFYNYMFSILIFYSRAFMFLVLFSLLLAGLGAYKLLSFLFMTPGVKRIATPLSLILLFVFAYPSLSTMTYYSNRIYHNLNDANYEALVYMRDNLPPHSVVLAPPVISTPIFPITGHTIFTQVLWDYGRTKKGLLALSDPCKHTSYIRFFTVNFIYQPGRVCDFMTKLDHDVYEVDLTALD